MTYSVYKISRGGQSYIGCTGQTVETRWRAHQKAAACKSPAHPFHQAIKLFGPSAFVVETIATFEGRMEAFSREADEIFRQGYGPHAFNKPRRARPKNLEGRPISLGSDEHLRVLSFWPTAAVLAQDIGCRSQTVQAWKRKKCIPPLRYDDVIAAAAKRGFKGVTYPLLASARPR